MLEKLIAFHCGPALAGIKCANLMSCRKSRIPDLHKKLDKFNSQLNCKDIYAEILCECEKNTLIMVYRKKLLEARLNDHETSEFLKGYGYDKFPSAEDYIERLKTRLKNNKFPHEIGVFLGYPIDDICDFIKNGGRKCIISGEWKVYHNPEKAERLFRRYYLCRMGIARRIKKGDSLAEIFCAA